MPSQPNDYYAVFQTESYDSANPETEGVWKYILDGEKVIGAVWTDWKDGAGVLWASGTSEVAEIRNHFSLYKDMKADAGLAYAQLDDSTLATFSVPHEGSLSEMLNTINKEEDDQE